MKYIVIYTDENKNIKTSVVDTDDISLADIKGRLLAYKNKGELINVKQIDFKDIIEEAIKLRSSYRIYNELQKIYGETIFIDNIEEISHMFDILLEKAKDDEYWFLINEEYIIAFIGEYNVYGLYEIKDIIIYDETDSILCQLQITEGVI